MSDGSSTSTETVVSSGEIRVSSKRTSPLRSAFFTLGRKYRVSFRLSLLFRISARISYSASPPASASLLPVLLDLGITYNVLNSDVRGARPSDEVLPASGASEHT